MIRDRFLQVAAELTEDEADRLSRPPGGWHTIQIHPPGNGHIPATVDNLVRCFREIQRTHFGIVNASPIAAYEIRRPRPDQLQLQVSVPTKRLERKVRAHLTSDIPELAFADGTGGLPVTSEDTVGGGILSIGRLDRYPLRTEFDQPPTNSVIAALHRHSMRDTRFVIQILVQPVAGQPIRQWWWRYRTYKRIGHLRREKESLWGSRSPTPREKSQADAIEAKAGQPRFHTSIRFAIIGAGEYTQSRVKEVAGAFNTLESRQTGQYLNTNTVRSYRRIRLIDFIDHIRRREYGRWSHCFQASEEELAGLLAVPDRRQKNLQRANP